MGPLRVISVLRHPDFRQIRLAALMVILVIATGTVGYMFIEKFPALDAFYMTMITIGTVGFMEVHPLSDAGRLFTSALILLSFGTFAYGLSAITSSIVEGQLASYFSGYKVKTEISHLKNHVIVCGFGRNGSQACEQLKNRGIPFVVIEKEDETLERLRQDEGILYIQGDATDDRVLEKARIFEARALISTLDKDTSNLFVVLSARNLNQKLHIISRASEEGSDKKLYIAGADNVIMPDKIGGAHMAALISRPDVLEFLDVLSSKSAGNEAHLEEIVHFNLKPEFADKSILELGIHAKTGVSVIGIRRDSGEFILNPDAEIKLDNSMKLFVLGTDMQISLLKKTYCNS
ncbi:MAG: NAD-binding protein [Bacteroidetes bacterium]|nr:NAD-binding protein [Bacteroidota bacterium]